MSAAVANEMTCQELVELVTDYLEDRKRALRSGAGALPV